MRMARVNSIRIWFVLHVCNVNFLLIFFERIQIFVYIFCRLLIFGIEFLTTDKIKIG